MTLENDPLQALFRDAEQEWPAEEFTARVMADVRRYERRKSLVGYLGLFGGLGLTWLLLPLIHSGLLAAAQYGVEWLELAGRPVAASFESGLLYVYGVAFAGYALLRGLVRFRFRPV